MRDRRTGAVPDDRRTVGTDGAGRRAGGRGRSVIGAGRPSPARRRAGGVPLEAELDERMHTSVNV